jgi:hypothetical protein
MAETYEALTDAVLHRNLGPALKGLETCTIPCQETQPYMLIAMMSFGIKEEYCSYWIRHGECDYSQQGKLTEWLRPMKH